MKFVDRNHEDFYQENISKTNSLNDPYRKALFYTLGLTRDTRDNINSLYDFSENIISFEGLNQGWQTGTSMRITRLAFNLYTGFFGDTGDEQNQDDCSDYTPYNLFDTSLMIYMFEAIKLRYPEYVTE